MTPSGGTGTARRVPPRVVITGATGRMGGELLATAGERDDVWAVAATTRTPAAIPIEDLELQQASELPELLADSAVDALIDFTVPEYSVDAVEAAADAGIASVVGTTGFDDGQLEALRTASESAPVLKAANFARGVEVLRQVVGEAAAAMADYDAEVIETHHSGKRDAPSGTAKTILDEIERARGAGGDEDASDGEDRVHGREGRAPREQDEVGVHAVRAGDITGVHEVLLADNHEELRITHRAEDRGVFAAGALDAAIWLEGREPGWYEFGDVLSGE